jgi:hypothetical protein
MEPALVITKSNIRKFIDDNEKVDPKLQDANDLLIKKFFTSSGVRKGPGAAGALGATVSGASGATGSGAAGAGRGLRDAAPASGPNTQYLFDYVTSGVLDPLMNASNQIAESYNVGIPSGPCHRYLYVNGYRFKMSTNSLYIRSEKPSLPNVFNDYGSSCHNEQFPELICGQVYTDGTPDYSTWQFRPITIQNGFIKTFRLDLFMYNDTDNGGYSGVVVKVLVNFTAKDLYNEIEIKTTWQDGYANNSDNDVYIAAEGLNIITTVNDIKLYGEYHDDETYLEPTSKGYDASDSNFGSVFFRIPHATFGNMPWPQPKNA